MSQTDEFQPLTPQQLTQASAMIGKAFWADPLSIYIYPHEAERARRLVLMYSIPLRYALRYGETLVASGLTGVSCWISPEYTNLDNLRMLRVGALRAACGMGLVGLWRINAADSYTRNIHRRCISEPHWYLWLLGVEPALQGQGLGSRLLRAGLERVDAASLPCYLDTTNPANVAFYQKFGFRLVHQATIPDSNVGVWSMIRSPRRILSRIY
ncbi:N-acetyltransferase [Ktedonosporobacter rubrisoli]|uniref:N-acetyltransferase n=1 Tax=Ktedonosporobacter rubrisoli TaxID=2509675 RepID=A0A4V0YYP7_KTERU|nr:GNAT family N-acetyltransferase [Ktedonosporobacter rubrisoli]QBD76961.1 N-acetyltransferase [Ktedonosporobacter rubrisoli]